MLTVFTPTYNRVHTLPKLYDSLVKQENKDFLWLIVDDGSGDGTDKLVEKWKNEEKIDIEYIYRENGGKMQAWNTGVSNCNTELFMCVDSDDYVSKNGINIVLSNWLKVKNDANVAGIVTYKGKTETELLSNYKFPDKQLSTIEAIYSSGFRGDCHLIYRTEILKQYPFPEIDGEKFITENYVFCQIDQTYKILVVPQIVLICTYLEDGYSASQNKLFLNNPKGYVLYYNLKTKFAKSIKDKFKFSVAYVASVKAAKDKQGFKKATLKFWYIVAWPLGCCIYFYRKHIKNKKRGKK